jgi:hypothetical protein
MLLFIHTQGVPMRNRVSLPFVATLLLTSSALCLTAGVAAAKPKKAPTADNLKGSYKGVYTPEGGESGQLTLKISSDNKRTRALKGTAKFGKKSYKLRGAYTAATRQVNLAGTVGRPPNITFVTVTGFLDEAATDLNGLYTITVPGHTEQGLVSVNR